MKKSIYFLLTAIISIVATVWMFFSSISTFFDADISKSFKLFLGSIALGVLSFVLILLWLWYKGDEIDTVQKTITTSKVNAETQKQEVKVEQNVVTPFYSFKNGDDEYLELRYTYDDVWIVGYKYREPVEDLKIGDYLIIEIDSDNRNDPDAIKISVYRDEDDLRHIGYLPKNSKLRDMFKDYLESDSKTVMGKLSDINGDLLRMNVGFYRIIKYPTTYFEFKKKREPIATISKKIKLEDVHTYKIGDELKIEQDYDIVGDYDDVKEKYTCNINGVSLGKASPKMIELSQDSCVHFFVSGITVNDDSATLKFAVYKL